MDEQGLVYHCDEETAEAALIYCQPGITDAVIPATIDPDVETYPEEPGVGTEFTVTTVRRNALKDAEDLETVVFEDPSKITTLEILSLANCQSLSKVNNQTTVQSALALFSHAQVGYNMFHNTGLGGASGTGAFDQEMDGDDRLELEVDDASKLEITASGDLTWVENQEGLGGYQTLTGQSVTITAAVGNTEEEQTKRYRVYFQTTGEDAELSIVPGKSESINNWAFEHHGTEDPYTFYIEFGTPPKGNTSGIPVICNYPNITSGGGGVTVWGVLVTPDEPEGSIIPSEDVMQVSWITRKDDFAVSVVSQTTWTGVVSDGSGGAKPDQNLIWKISVNRNAEDTSPYGKDHATGVEFRDVITLPAGIAWREDVARAIANGEVSARGKNLYVGDTLIASIGESSSWSSIALFIRGRSLTLENGEYVVRWGVFSSDTSAEMNAMTINVCIYADALRLDVSEDSQYDTAAGATFTDEVYATVHYSYADDEAYGVDAETGETVNDQLYASGSRKIAGGKGILYISNTASPTRPYFGEDVQYDIVAFNYGALPWRGEVIHQERGYFVRESLDKLMYIKPENMERMLEENPELSITINNALLGQLQVVSGVYEGTECLLNPANSDSIASTIANLTISSAPEGYAVSVKNGETYTGSSLAEILQGIGYAVDDATVFTCNWKLSETGEKFVFPGGASRDYNVYARVKDTFQAIITDWEIQYNSGKQVDILSTALVNTPTNNLVAGTTTYRSISVIRDAGIEITDVSRDGESLPGSYAVNNGDVLDYTLTLTHYGQGTIEDLPLINDIYGSQYLLVPQDLNPGLADLQTHGDFYILAPGTYENVYVGVDDEGRDLLAASIVVEPADDEALELGEESYNQSGLHTRIHWYFPEIAPGAYQITVDYQTLVDLNLTGVNYAIGNMVALNDRVDHRLLDTIWGEGTLLNFDKAIVAQIGSTPGTDILEGDDHSLVGQGEAVTYRLEMRSNLDSEVTLNGTKIADALPISAGDFQWQKDVNVVDLRVVADEGVTYEGLDDWYIGDEYGGLLGTRQYLLWPETANITFTEPGAIYLYITLVYPENTEDSDLWDRFAELSPDGTFCNDFYVYRNSVSVEHDLKEPGRVLLQKGVFGNYYYGYGYEPQANLKTSNSRLNYNNTDRRYRSAAYYVLIYNDSSKRLYLNELYDQLPEGFTFRKFIDANGSVNALYVGQRITMIGGTGVLTQVDDPNVSYKSATITADTTDGLKFIVSAGTGADALRYDAQMQQYYLESGEALEFGYLCDVGTVDQTEDVATNMIAMPYTDYLGTGVSAVSREEIRVTAAEQEMHFDDVNDGRRYVKDDLQMLVEYGIAGTGDWLVSDVSLYRGSIIPGVTKYVDSYQASFDSQVIPYENQVYHNSIVNWRVRLHNSGTLAMVDYTFEDEVQWPYSFVGDVMYTCYGTGAYQEEAFSLISIPQHDPHNDDTVKVHDYIGNTDRTVTINADPIKCGGGNKEFYVSICVNESGNEVLSVRFKTPNFSIMEGSYVDVSLSTANFTGSYTYSVYTNQAALKPAQEFTTVGQGSVVKDAEGNKVAVKNAASVAVSNGFVTVSNKTVSAIGQAEQERLMVLPNIDDAFIYTLSVTNDTKHEMTKLVILDNLPNVGDHNPFDTNAVRNSEFMISLLEGQTVSVQILPVDAEAYTPANYRVQYSTGTDFAHLRASIGQVKHQIRKIPPSGQRILREPVLSALSLPTRFLQRLPW